MKYFQIIYLSEKVLLCDCFGFVFFNFVNIKVEFVCNGVLLIDQFCEYIGFFIFVVIRIFKFFLEVIYGIQIYICFFEEGGNGIFIGEELFRVYVCYRGFMIQGFG